MNKVANSSNINRISEQREKLTKDLVNKLGRKTNVLIIQANSNSGNCTRNNERN